MSIQIDISEGCDEWPNGLAFSVPPVSEVLQQGALLAVAELRILAECDMAFDVTLLQSRILRRLLAFSPRKDCGQCG